MDQSEDKDASRSSSVFPAGYRASGILLHVTSLPSQYGIGDFGPQALAWIDRLADAGQTWWQILPIGPPDKGNSPYTPLSTFACNPLLISPDGLLADGLVRESDCEITDPFPTDYVDFDRVILWKDALLARAFANYCSNRDGVRSKLSSEFEAFCEGHARWLDDFALFVSLKLTFKDANYVDWPKGFLLRERTVLQSAMIELAKQIERVKFDQFLAFRQLHQVRTYAAQRGIKLFGDLPIFVSADSSDVWSHPDLFMLDERMRPKFVAGVPPDYFSETGQLWGNPVYNWAALRRSGYAWWIDRLRSLMELHDLVRLDHFRGFSAAWHVPAGALTAVDGEWVDGPGSDFFMAVKRALGGLPFVAEDLGTITDDVRALLTEFAFPKMGVLQFAFDGDPTNAFLPHHSVENMVVYTGTHDNDTSRGWYRTLPPAHRKAFWKYLALDDGGDVDRAEVDRADVDGLESDRSEADGREVDVAWSMIQLAWGTRAAVTIAPLQDILNRGGEARMNMPGVANGNWAWRCTEQELRTAPWEQLRELTDQHQRTCSARTGQAAL